MSIIIPQKLSNLINGLTDEVSVAVGSTVSATNPLLIRNEAPFFPDYTDHGVLHVNNVLKTCEMLISDDSWGFFSRDDAAALIMATLAHDLGMLINVDGFRFLVDPKNSLTTNSNDMPWHKLWREFQLDTQRFDGATMMVLLGSPEPILIERVKSCQLY